MKPNFYYCATSFTIDTFFNGTRKYSFNTLGLSKHYHYKYLNKTFDRLIFKSVISIIHDSKKTIDIRKAMTSGFLSI